MVAVVAAGTRRCAERPRCRSAADACFQGPSDSAGANARTATVVARLRRPGVSYGGPVRGLAVCRQRPVANGPVPALRRLAGLARLLAGRLRLPDRGHSERHAVHLRQGLRGGRHGDCHLRAAAGLYALLRAVVLRLGLSPGGGAGDCRRAAGAGADLDRPCPGTSGLRLPRSGGAFRRNGHGLDHLPLRSVCRPLPPHLQRLDACLERGIPGRRAVHRPALLPLALPLRGYSGAAVAASPGGT